MYKCMSCGKDVEVDISVSRKVICPFCGYRILKKKRPVQIKKVKAV